MHLLSSPAGFPASHLTAAAALALAACAVPARTDSVPAGSAAARALAGADSLHVEALAPGVRYLRAWEGSGPWAIHVVEVDTARCVPVWSARKPPGPLAARSLTSSLADSALAAVNADFFQLPGGTPVGPHVNAGRVWIGPGDRPAWLSSGRTMTAGSARLDGEAIASSDTVALVQVNRAARTTSSYRPPTRGATLFTALAAAVPPADSAADVVLLQVLEGDARQGAGRVVRVLRSPVDSARLAAGEVAVQVLGADRAWATRRTPGDTVRWSARLLPASAAGTKNERPPPSSTFTLLSSS